MLKSIYLMFISLAFFSCSQNSPENTDSATAAPPVAETDPLQEAKEIYGGLIIFDKNKSEITASSSPKLNQMADMASLPASHIAWLFYKNQQDFDGDTMRVVIKLSDGSSPVFSFPLQQIKVANERIPVIQQAANYLIKDDYKNLHAQFAPNVAAQMTQQDLGAFCNQAFEQYGKPVRFTFQGFNFFNLSGKNKELIHLAGSLQRQKKDTPLSLYVEPETGQLYSIKFEY